MRCHAMRCALFVLFVRGKYQDRGLNETCCFPNRYKRVSASDSAHWSIATWEFRLYCLALLFTFSETMGGGVLPICRWWLCFFFPCFDYVVEKVRWCRSWIIGCECRMLGVNLGLHFIDSLHEWLLDSLNECISN